MHKLKVEACSAWQASQRSLHCPVGGKELAGRVRGGGCVSSHTPAWQGYQGSVRRVCDRVDEGLAAKVVVTRMTDYSLHCSDISAGL